MDSLIELKEHEDLSLADEADRNWTEVLDQTYIFNRKRREVIKTFASPDSRPISFSVFGDVLA